MKLTLLVCLVLCFSTLVATVKPWRKMLKKFKKVVNTDTEFMHIIPGYRDLSNEDFNLAKRAAMVLSKAVDARAPIGWRKSQIGLTQFSTMAFSEIRFTNHDNLASYLDAIEQIKQHKGLVAAVGTGLDVAKQQFEWSSYYQQKGRAQVVWLVTDRFSEIGTNANAVANRLKNGGIKIFVVGIGNINRWKELKELASGAGFYFHFASFKDYSDAVNNVKNAIK